jgi:hypothetical protein
MSKEQTTWKEMKEKTKKMKKMKEPEPRLPADFAPASEAQRDHRRTRTREAQSPRTVAGSS